MHGPDPNFLLEQAPLQPALFLGCCFAGPMQLQIFFFCTLIISTIFLLENMFLKLPLRIVRPLLRLSLAVYIDPTPNISNKSPKGTKTFARGHVY